MPESLQPQPWWAAIVGGGLFTIRWLIGFGAKGASTTIKSQQEEIARLNARVNRLEQRETDSLTLIEELRAQNAMLRKALRQAGIDVPM